MKLLYNNIFFKYFCIKTELLNFDITLSVAKLALASSRLVSNGLIFSGDTLADI